MKYNIYYTKILIIAEKSHHRSCSESHRSLPT